MCKFGLSVAMEEVKRMTRPYPLRIPEGILQLAELRGREERTDKTTALRQWLYAAAEEYAFKRLAEGRLTLSQTAELYIKPARFSPKYFAPSSRAAGLSLRKGQSASLHRVRQRCRLISVGTKR